LPQHKSAAKRMKTSERERQENKRIKSIMRGALKTYQTDKEKSPEKFKAVTKILDKAASKKVIHKNKAARLKSRMAKQAAKQVKQSK